MEAPHSCCEADGVIWVVSFKIWQSWWKHALKKVVNLRSPSVNSAVVKLKRFISGRSNARKLNFNTIPYLLEFYEGPKQKYCRRISSIHKHIFNGGSKDKSGLFRWSHKNERGTSHRVNIKAPPTHTFHSDCTISRDQLVDRANSVAERSLLTLAGLGRAGLGLPGTDAGYFVTTETIIPWRHAANHSVKRTSIAGWFRRRRPIRAV